MSSRKKLMYGLLTIIIVIVSADLFQQKFEKQILSFQYDLSTNLENRVKYYNLVHLAPEDRIEDFSYNTAIGSGEYTVGENLNLPSGWYSFTNKDNDVISVTINGNVYKLNPDYKKSLGATTIELYINPGDQISSTGNVAISRTKIYV